MTPLSDVARGKWKPILKHLGIADSFLTGKHGPCPICGGKDRFRFTDHKQGGGYYCNACGHGDGIDLLQKLNGWSFRDCDEAIRPIVGDFSTAKPVKDAGPSLDALRAIWREAVAIRANDDAGRYWASRRLPLIDCPDLRFHPACRVTRVPGVTRLPAMLALIRDPAGEVTAIHRTYLTDGAKANIDEPKRYLGKIKEGAAIRLSRHGGRLGVAEGIETAMAVMRDKGIPCWSTMDAGRLGGFVWGDGVDRLEIFGDNDAKFAGQFNAYKLANRATTNRRPIQAEVYIPPKVGDDWLDDGNARLDRDRAGQ